MSNVCVVSFYSDNIKLLAALTLYFNKGRYCKKHGYDLDIRRYKLQKTDRGILGIAEYPYLGFEKIRVILELLEQYELVYWCGADTLITNYNIRLEDLVKSDFTIGADVWALNADSFIVRSSDRAKQFLKHLLSLYEVYIVNGVPQDFGRRLPDGGGMAWGEQMAMIDLSEEYSDIVTVMPQRTMNSYLYHIYPGKWHQAGKDFLGNDGAWQNGDFLLHLPGMPDQTRLQIVQHILEEVVGDECN